MNTEETSELKYIPGVCNIGPIEIKRRLRNGYIGLGISLLFISVVMVFGLSQFWKIGLFFPIAFSLAGFLQARKKFCLLYGFFGLFSITGKRNTVHLDEQYRQDRNMALQLTFQVVIGSICITLLYYYLG